MCTFKKERRLKLDSKFEKCIFIKYKDGVTGYKLWNPSTRTVVYSRDVIFRQLGITSDTEELIRVKGPENVEFNLKNESHNFDGSIESEEQVEVQTPVVRRSG